MKKQLVAAPRHPKVSLLGLYQKHTEDTRATHDEVYSAVLCDSPERIQAISLRLKGYSCKQIGAALNLSHGAIDSKIGLAMKTAWKRINLESWRKRA